MLGLTTFDQIVPFFKEGERGSIDQLIREKYTPSLFTHTLIERSSWQGLATDFIRRCSYFETENKRWKTIFRDLFAQLNEQKIQELSLIEKNAFYELKSQYIKKTAATQQPLDTLKSILEAHIPTQKTKQTTLHWTQDPAELHKLSLLSTSKEADPAVDSDILQALLSFGSEGSFSDDLQILNKLVHYIKGKLADHTEAETMMPALDLALTTETYLQESIQSYQQNAEGSISSGIEDLAKNAFETIQGLPPGGRCLFIGGVPAILPQLNVTSNTGYDSETKTGSLFPLLNKFLTSQELETKINQYIENFFHSVQEIDTEALLPEEVEKKFHSLLTEGFIGTFLPGLKKSLFDPKNEFVINALLFIPEVIRLGTETTLSFLEKEFIESLTEEFTTSTSKKLLSLCRKGILEKNLQSTFKDKARTEIKKLLIGNIGHIRNTILNNITHVSSQLPQRASLLLKAFGYGDLGQPKTPLWFEICCQPEGKCTLLIYGTGQAANLHGTTILKYADIPLEKLDHDFFLRLFLYRAEPECDSTFHYQLKDIHEGLLATLDTQPTAHECYKQNLDADVKSIPGPWALLKAFLSTRLNFASEKERNLYFYQWKKDALIDLWKQFKKESASENKPSLSIIEQATYALIQETLNLYRAGSIRIEELKIVYATTWEILSEIKKDPQPEQKATPARKPILIPPEIRHLFGIVGGENAHLVKGILVDILGKKAANSLNLILEDLYPKTEQLPQTTQNNFPKVVAEKLLGLGKRSVNVLMNATIGLSITDITQPRRFSYFKIALSVARLALSILFPQIALTMNLQWTIGVLAKEALFEIAEIFLPTQLRQMREQLHRFRQWQLRAIAYATACLLLNEDQLQALNEVVTKYAGYLTHSGKISYELSPVEMGTSNPFTLEPYQPLIENHTITLITTENFYYSFSTTPITTENCLEVLQGYISIMHQLFPDIKALENQLAKSQAEYELLLEHYDAYKPTTGIDPYQKQIPSEISEKYFQIDTEAFFLERAKKDDKLPLKRLLHCIEIVKSLPMPKPDDQTDCWLEVQNFEECLQYISELSHMLYAAPSGISMELRHQTFICLYKTYAIAYKLAQRCPKANLRGIPVNPWALALIKENPGFQLINPHFIQEYEGICHYFGIDIHKHYTQNDINGAGTVSLFFGIKTDTIGVDTECPQFVSTAIKYMSDTVDSTISTIAVPVFNGIDRLNTASGDYLKSSAEQTSNGLQQITSGASSLLKSLSGYVVTPVASPLRSLIAPTFNAVGHSASSAVNKVFSNRHPESNSFLSNREGEYYEKLLHDPEIHKQLEANRIPSDAPFAVKFGHLIANDFHLLPRTFFLLRQINFFANEYASHLNDTRPSADLELEESYLSFQDYGNSVHDFLRHFSWGSWSLAGDKEKYKAIPGNYSACQKKAAENASNLTILSPDLKSVKNTLAGRICRRIGLFNDCSSARMDGDVYTVSVKFSDMRKYLQTFYFFETFFEHLNHPRFPSEIVNEVSSFEAPENQSHTILSDLSSNERKAIEMLWSSEEDRIVRTLAYFSSQLDLFKSVSFRVIFEILLLQGNLLDKQLETDPEFSQTLGKFFIDAIEHHHPSDTLFSVPETNYSDLERLFAFIRLGIFVRAKAKFFNPEADQHFPDFAFLCRIPHKHLADITIADIKLLSIWSLYFMNPFTATREEKQEACRLLQFALMIETKKSSRTSSQIAEITSMWKPIWEAELDKNVEMRNRLLNAWAKRKRFIGRDESPTWTGNFPHYSTGFISVRVDLDNLRIESAETDSEVEKKIRQHLQRIYSDAIDTLELIRTNEGYQLMEKDIHIRVCHSDSKIHLEFHKIINGRLCVWVHPSSEVWPEVSKSEPVTYWLEKGFTSLLHRLENGNRTNTLILDSTKDGQFIPILSPTLNYEVDLSQESHGLGLLEWFQPRSKIRVVRSDKPPYDVDFIQFTELELNFAVKPINGKKQAVSVNCREIQGFYIAKKQKQENKVPALAQHSSYLLLENAQKQNKVVLVSEGLHSAVTSWLLRTMTGICSSKWIDASLNKVLDPILKETGLKDLFKSTYYIYSVDSEGRLTSQDPEAILHLLLYSLTQSDFTLAIHYLEMTEHLGTRILFSDAMINFMRYLEAFSGVTNDPILVALVLRLSASRIENRQTLQTKEPTEGTKPQLFQEWLFLQTNYYHFLNQHHDHPHLKLSEIQELCILRSIVQLGKKFLGENTFLGQGSHILFDKLKQTLGLEALSEGLLMIPQISKRYRFLLHKYSLPGELHFEPIKRLATSAIHGQFFTGNASETTSTSSKNPTLSTEVGIQTSTLEQLFFYLSPSTRTDATYDLPFKLLETFQIGDDFIQNYRHAYIRPLKGEENYTSTEGQVLNEEEIATATINENCQFYLRYYLSKSQNISGFNYLFLVHDLRYQHFFPTPERLERLYKAYREIRDQIPLEKDPKTIQRLEVEAKNRWKTIHKLLNDAQRKALYLEVIHAWEKAPVHFSEYNGDDLQIYFIAYYQMALEKPPLGYASDPEKQKAFLAKAKTFKKSLLLMHGKTPDEQQLLNILKEVAKTPPNTPFITFNEYGSLIGAIKETSFQSVKNKLFNRFSPFPCPQLFEKLLKESIDEQAKQTNQFSLVEIQKLNTFTNALLDSVGSFKTKQPELFRDPISLFLHEFLPNIKRAYSYQQTAKWVAKGAVAKVADKALGLAVNGAVSYLPSLLLPISPATVGMGLTALWAYDKYQQASVYAANLKSDYDEVSGNGIAGQERQALEKTIQAIEAPLPPAWLKRLKKEDHAYTQLGSQLLETHFAPLAKSEKAVKTPIEPFASPLQTPCGQQIFAEHNQSLVDYYARPETEQFPHELHSLESYHQLNAQLERIKKRLEINLKAKKERFFKEKKNKVEETSDEAILTEQFNHLLSHKPTDQIPLSLDLRFNALLLAFVRNDDQKLLQISGYREKHLPKLKLELYRYLVQATRLQQIQRAQKSLSKVNPTQLASLESKILLKEIGFELGRKRVYSFDNSLPTRILRHYLVFEFQNNVFLRAQQVGQMQKVLLDQESELSEEHAVKHRNQILQSKTGSGKTSFGAPIFSAIKSNGHYVVNNIVPESLIDSQIPDLSNRSRKLGQKTHSTPFRRDTFLNAEMAWNLIRKHLNALYGQETLACGKLDRQSLELYFIELAHKASSKKTLTEEEEAVLWQLMQLLKFIRTRVIANIDEAHKLLAGNTMLNHPLGRKKKVKKSYINVISECVRLLVAIPEIAQRISLKEHKQSLCTTEYYRNEIKPQLAEQLANYRPFKISPENKAEFANYLCGNLDADGNLKPIPAFIAKHPRLSDIDMARGMLDKILEDALQKNVHVDFGTKGNKHGYAQPYEGNDTPTQNSIFQLPHEAIAKTLIACLFDPLTCKQVRELWGKMGALATKESEEKKRPFQQTKYARLIAAWTKKRFTLTPNLLPTVEDLRLATELLNQGYAARMSYARLFTIEHIEYYTQNISSNPYNFVSMFAGYTGATASPRHPDTNPVGTELLLDKGTAGEFTDYMCRSCTDDHIRTLDGQNPKELLRELLQKDFSENSPSKAIIDGAALLQGMSNQDVANETLNFMKESRPDLRAVTFYDQNNQHVIQEVGRSPIPFSESSISPSERLTYFDDIHTFGADIPQAPKAKANVSISHKTAFDELMQWVGRMRDRENGQQTIDIILKRDVKDLIPPTETSMVRNIISNTLVNKANQEEKEIYPADLMKISDRVRRAVLDSLINAYSVKDMLRYMRLFSSYLITETEEDPTVLFPLEVDCPTQEALKLYREQHFKVLQRNTAVGWRERQQIKKELEQIGSSMLPPTVRVAFKNGKMEAYQSALGMTQSVVLSQDIEQNQTIDVNQDQEIEQNLDLQLKVLELSSFSASLRKEPACWNANVDYMSSLDWWKVLPEAESSHYETEIYAIQDSFSKAKNALLDVSEAFSGEMYWTNNVRGILTNGDLADVCSQKQLPFNEVLVIEGEIDGEKTLMTCAIDSHDGEFWRQILKKDRNNSTPSTGPKIAIFDLELNTIVSEGSNRYDRKALHANKTFNFDIARWKFLAAHVNLQKGAVEVDEEDQSLYTRFMKWVDMHDIDKMRAAFEFIYASRGFLKTQDSQMDKILSPTSHDAFVELV